MNLRKWFYLTNGEHYLKCHLNPNIIYIFYTLFFSVVIYYPIAKSAKNFFFIISLKYHLLWSSATIAILLIVNIYGGFMEGLEGKEERSFLHVLCWQCRSSSLREMVITLVLRILPLQSWTWHFLSKSSPLHKETAPSGAIIWNKRIEQHYEQ